MQQKAEQNGAADRKRRQIIRKLTDHLTTRRQTLAINRGRRSAYSFKRIASVLYQLALSSNRAETARINKLSSGQVDALRSRYGDTYALAFELIHGQPLSEERAKPLGTKAAADPFAALKAWLEGQGLRVDEDVKPGLYCLENLHGLTAHQLVQRGNVHRQSRGLPPIRPLAEAF